VSNEQPLTSANAVSTSPTHDYPRQQHDDGKVVFWHRELPPLDAEPLGEHTVDANSTRVTGTLDRRGDLWDRCYRDVMAQVDDRLRQEVRRLGGDYAHVLDETIDSRRDDRTGDVWLRCRLKYLLLRRPQAI
jgi:hypothetical protein